MMQGCLAPVTMWKATRQNKQGCNQFNLDNRLCQAQY